MKITAIKTFLGSFGNRSRGLIKVETDEGLYGWGEAYSIGPDRSVEPIADYIFEMIKGEDPRRKLLSARRFRTLRQYTDQRCSRYQKPTSNFRKGDRCPAYQGGMEGQL